MRKEKARAIAICALIDDGIKYGYPGNYKGRMFMDAAMRWLEDDRQNRATDAGATCHRCHRNARQCKCEFPLRADPPPT